MFLADAPTEFAPATRAPFDELRRQASLFMDHVVLEDFANAVPNIILILNRHRQIVFANAIVRTIFPEYFEVAVIGLRPGEALHCQHARETDGGCGTTRYCQQCGAVKAILICQKGEANVQECRLIQEKNIGALDLRVTATPLTIEGETFTVFSAVDIADEKRRDALERIFFHDVLNTATGLQGYSDLIGMSPAENHGEYHSGIRALTATLIEEIRFQQNLSNAERGEFEIERTLLGSQVFLAHVIESVRGLGVARSTAVQMSAVTENVTVRSDKRLLHRVVGNMAKNAIEASKPGQTVTLGCHAEDGHVRFWVHNQGVIPSEVQLQIFQRSFSTKGKGRGLGTYSIKLLGEKFLGGTAGFESTLEAGTTFWLDVPWD